ncbi:protein of unknown function (plasmid) [Rhodovastum atsumiense]|nr:protein of unknown function [Rhodovastum atsumiense]
MPGRRQPGHQIGAGGESRRRHADAGCDEALACEAIGGGRGRDPSGFAAESGPGMIAQDKRADMAAVASFKGRYFRGELFGIVA